MPTSTFIRTITMPPLLMHTCTAAVMSQSVCRPVLTKCAPRVLQTQLQRHAAYFHHTNLNTTPPARHFAATSRNSAKSSHTSYKHSLALHHVLTISDLTRAEIVEITSLAQDIRHVPQMYGDRMNRKSLVMLFEKPSLRTRLSFEIGMTQLGGHGVYYELGEKSNLGGKETIEDTARVIARYADIVMARVKSRHVVRKLAEWSDVPVINALDDYGHPCQILADVQTIVQKKGSAVMDEKHKLKVVYLGDIANNVTYDWMRVSAIMGWTFVACGPSSKTYAVEQEVLDDVKELSSQSGADVTVSHDVQSSVVDADVVMTDSWMSYHLNKAEQEQRFTDLKPYRVTTDVMKHAASDAIFMHCLPAGREAEVEAAVIDGKQSVVFDQAENRLHAQKALMCWLLREKQQK